MFLQPNAPVIDNIKCLVGACGKIKKSAIPHLMTSHLMNLMNSNNFRFRKMCALAGAVAIIACAILLGFSGMAIAASAVLLCAIVPLACLIKTRNDQKKWPNRVNIEMTTVIKIYTDMKTYFVDERKKRENEIINEIKTTGLTSKSLDNIEAENVQTHKDMIQFANSIVQLPNPRWKPFPLKEWGQLQLACDTYLQPHPSKQHYIEVIDCGMAGKQGIPHPQSSL